MYDIVIRGRSVVDGTGSLARKELPRPRRRRGLRWSSRSNRVPAHPDGGRRHPAPIRQLSELQAAGENLQGGTSGRAMQTRAAKATARRGADFTDVIPTVQFIFSAWARSGQRNRGQEFFGSPCF